MYVYRFFLQVLKGLSTLWLPTRGCPPRALTILISLKDIFKFNGYFIFAKIFKFKCRYDNNPVLDILSGLII